MTGRRLVEKLRKLGKRGDFKVVATSDGDFYEIRLYETPKSYGAWDVEVLKDDEVSGSPLWIVEGWLVSQLEARGLRRSINQYVNGTLDMYLQEREGGVVCASQLHTEEINALIECCLSLPTEATP
jgi:hypothetical protein